MLPYNFNFLLVLEYILLFNLTRYQLNNTTQLLKPKQGLRDFENTDCSLTSNLYTCFFTTVYQLSKIYMMHLSMAAASRYEVPLHLSHGKCVYSQMACQLENKRRIQHIRRFHIH